jgi:hypothetical protein
MRGEVMADQYHESYDKLYQETKVRRHFKGHQ